MRLVVVLLLCWASQPALQQQEQEPNLILPEDQCREHEDNTADPCYPHHGVCYKRPIGRKWFGRKYVGILVMDDLTVTKNVAPSYRCDDTSCCGKTYHDENKAMCSSQESSINVNTCYGDMLCGEEGDRIKCKKDVLCYPWEKGDNDDYTQCEERLECMKTSGCPLRCDIQHLCGDEFAEAADGRRRCLRELWKRHGYLDKGFKSEYLVRAQRCIERNFCPSAASLKNVCSTDHLEDSTECRTTIFLECKSSICKLSPLISFGDKSCADAP